MSIANAYTNLLADAMSDTPSVDLPQMTSAYIRSFLPAEYHGSNEWEFYFDKQVPKNSTLSVWKKTDSEREEDAFVVEFSEGVMDGEAAKYLCQVLMLARLTKMSRNAHLMS